MADDEQTDDAQDAQTAVAEPERGDLNAQPPAAGSDTENPFDWDEPSEAGASATVPTKPAKTSARSGRKAAAPATEPAEEQPEPIRYADEEEPEATTEDDQDAGDEDADFPDDLLDRAAAVGIAEEDALRFHSADELAEFLAPIESKLKTPATSPAAAPRPAAEATAPKKTETPEEFKVQFDESLVDPEVGDAIKAMVGEINRLRGELVKAQTSFDGQVESNRQTAFDVHVERLGDPWKDTFGEGPTHSLSHRTKAWQNRERVLKHADRLRKVYEAEGNGVPQDGELWDQAIGGLFRSKQDSVARQELTNKVKKRRGQMTSRPAPRQRGKETERPGKAKATATARRIMRERHMMDDQETDLDFWDSFPG